MDNGRVVNEITEIGNQILDLPIIPAFGYLYRSTHYRNASSGICGRTEPIMRLCLVTMEWESLVDWEAGYGH